MSHIAILKRNQHYSESKIRNEIFLPFSLIMDLTAHIVSACIVVIRLVSSQSWWRKFQCCTMQGPERLLWYCTTL